jgi:hypothetical protein
MLFKNSVRTSKRTPHFTITKINWLTLFKFKQIRMAGCYSIPVLPDSRSNFVESLVVIFCRYEWTVLCVLRDGTRIVCEILFLKDVESDPNV